MQIYSNDRRIDQQKILVCLRRGWDGKAIRFRSYNHRNATNSTFSPILQSYPEGYSSARFNVPVPPCKPISSWIPAKSHRNGTMTTPNPNGFESLILSLSPSAGGKFLSSLRNVFLPILILLLFFSTDFTKKKEKGNTLRNFYHLERAWKFPGVTRVLHLSKSLCLYPIRTISNSHRFPVKWKL